MDSVASPQAIEIAPPKPLADRPPARAKQASTWVDAQQNARPRRFQSSYRSACYSLQKFGFQIEGTQIGYAFRDGQYVDTLMMARVRLPSK